MGGGEGPDRRGEQQAVPRARRAPVLELLPGLRSVAVFLPDRAGQVPVRLHSRPIDEFGPVTGLAVLAAWALAALLVAWWALRRRDA